MRVSKSAGPGFSRNRPAPAWRCVQRSTRRPASHLAEQGFPGCQELAPRVRGYHVGVPLSTSSNPIPPEAAISAFLRGIEPRAFVFARAQCGDEALARLALAATVADFRQIGAEKPLAHWPRDFWSALLAQPALLQSPASKSHLEAMSKSSPAKPSPTQNHLPSARLPPTPTNRRLLGRVPSAP